MRIVKQRLKTLINIFLVLLALMFFSMPALIPLHDWIEYRGSSQGEISFIEYNGDKCASIAVFQVDDKTYYSKSSMSSKCKKSGMVNINYDESNPARNSQTLTIPLIYALLFFSGIIAGLTAWFVRKWIERKQKVPVEFIEKEISEDSSGEEYLEDPEDSLDSEP